MKNLFNKIKNNKRVSVSTINVSETPMQNYAKKGNGYARISLVK